MKDAKENTKSERKGGHERDKDRRNKSAKEGGNQQQAINPLPASGGPQPLMSQGQHINLCGATPLNMRNFL